MAQWSNLMMATVDSHDRIRINPFKISIKGYYIIHMKIKKHLKTFFIDKNLHSSCGLS